MWALRLDPDMSTLFENLPLPGFPVVSDDARLPSAVPPRESSDAAGDPPGR